MRAAVKQLDSSRAGGQGPSVVLMLRMRRVSHRTEVSLPSCGWYGLTLSGVSLLKLRVGT